ncbi:MAG: AmmeMemoRadiSam system protein A [Melioribacteraceae bacterium]|nr:AmmeMemoRadiSam system protein A [Melioribacteraceae bacterium]MCF8265569.1 AmmeMemoRadiSam system protein A [Melioribacteraceae bacterium]MCF8413875.1 AmmeMemoRadiSam system protein A [Melioribacteraceae bacterium]MCF8430955.1 AmmeMemoRadiSam system protein A [Melioribacteraceae bacterium]
MELTKEEKSVLIKIARDSIKNLFDDNELVTPDIEKHPVLNSNCGAFVTLKINNSLRGCIGYIISDQPLYSTISDAALQSAGNDPRFPKLTRTEFEQVKIEISVLSEPFPLKSYDEIILGKHGLILEEGGHRALLLPQVPAEHGMNKDQFLSALCEKGGFKADLWKRKKLTLKAFTAIVFDESDL